MRHFFLLLFLSVLMVHSGHSQSSHSKELYDLHRKGEIDILKGMVSAQPGKAESDTTLYIRFLITEDGEKAVGYLEQLVEKYPRSEYAVAAYGGMYLYYLANDNFRKANNCVRAVENEFPGESISYFLEDTLSPEGEGVE